MSKTQKIKIIFAIISISFIQGLQYCVSPILLQIQNNYPSVNVSLIQMLVTAPALIAMVIALLSGWLVVKISKKKLLLFGSFIAGITGFMPFLADSFTLLFVSRLLFGIGLGIAVALNTAVVAEFFEGDERVNVMGIQASSIGAGMVVITTLGGILGSSVFKNAYYINIIGFISMIVIAICLPETGKAVVTKTEKIKITKDVYIVCLFGFLEFLFLITFTTNIAMHISGELAGSTSATGLLMGMFSVIQILVGIILGKITKITKKYTLPVAMFCFCIGGVLLILYPENIVALTIGALFCGFSQGMFIPTAMVDVSNAVKPIATAMATACFTVAICLGQVVSPTLLNSVAKFTLNEASTTNIYIVAVIGMTISSICLGIFKNKKKGEN